MYKFIAEHSKSYPVRKLCEVLMVSKSTYYAYQKADSGVQRHSQESRKASVRRIFEKHRKRYGARRIQMDLRAEGIQIGRGRIRKYMKEMNLKAIQPRSFVPKTTNSKHGQKRSPNLFLETYHNQPPAAPDEVYVGDITYLPQVGGRWLYLATWMDLYSRKIVGYEVADNMRATLVISALEKAYMRRGAPQGVMIHTDGGGQYVDGGFRKLIMDKKGKQSMTRKDNHYDNAFGESVFSRLKAELLTDHVFTDLNDAKAVLFDYIECYYNRVRRHSGISYHTPDEHEKLYWVG